MTMGCYDLYQQVDELDFKYQIVLKMTWSTLQVKFIPSCFFDLEILASMALALISVPRGGWPSPEYG